MSLLLPDSGLLFWMFLSFGIVFVILAKYGFPVIIKMVEGRKTYIDQSLEVAREANAQLSKLKQEGDALVAAANKEQGRILKEAMEERDKIVHEARKQAEIAAQKELDAVRAVFGELAAEVPLVNYNGHFGFVESAAGLLNPVIAGAAMAFSSVSVVTNALLLKRWRGRQV